MLGRTPSSRLCASAEGVRPQTSQPMRCRPNNMKPTTTPEGWKTIDSAPKDGTFILLAGGRPQGWICRPSGEDWGALGPVNSGFWSDAYDVWAICSDQCQECGGGRWQEPPTHWQPLPAAPFLLLDKDGSDSPPQQSSAPVASPTPEKAANPHKAAIYAGDWSASAGKPYQPSNGAEGEMFMSRWCSGCERDRAFREDRGDSCEIVAMTMCADIDDPEYPKEWRHDDAGVPECTAWEPEDQ